MANSAVYSELTWDVLASQEPRLASLARIAAALDPADEEGWAYRVKPVLCDLIGHASRRPEHDPLASSRAYVVAYDYLLALRETA